MSMAHNHVPVPFSTPTAYTASFWSPLIATFFLVSAIALSSMLTRRIPVWGSWRTTPAARLAVTALLADSLVFVTIAGILTLGVGTSRSPESCNIGVWLCVTFYTSSKFIITIFLMERLYMVHGRTQRRRESKLYLLSCVFALAWVGVLLALLLKKYTTLRPDGQCVFTLSHEAFYAVAALDTAVNLYFSCMFAFPLYRGAFSSRELHVVALKSLIGAGISMASSVTNSTVIASLGGHELSWICLSSCTVSSPVYIAIATNIGSLLVLKTKLDILINASTIFSITAAPEVAQHVDNELQTRRPSIYTQKETLSTDPRIVESRVRLARAKSLAVSEECTDEADDKDLQPTMHIE